MVCCSVAYCALRINCLMSPSPPQAGSHHQSCESTQKVTVHSQAGQLLETQAPVSQWGSPPPQTPGQQPRPENKCSGECGSVSMCVTHDV